MCFFSSIIASYLIDSDDHLKLFSVFLHVANSLLCCMTVIFKVVFKGHEFILRIGWRKRVFVCVWVGGGYYAYSRRPETGKGEIFSKYYSQ